MHPLLYHSEHLPSTITPIPTIHSHVVASQAYLIEYHQQKILYTGDMMLIENRYHHLLSDCDAIITEGSFIDAGGLVRCDKVSGRICGHAGILDLIELFSSYTDTIILTHFGQWFYKDMQSSRKKIKQLGKKYHCRIIIGYNGFSIRL